MSRFRSSATRVLASLVVASSLLVAPSVAIGGGKTATTQHFFCPSWLCG